MSDNVRIFKLDNVLIIKKNRNGDFFFTTSDSIAIPVFNFSSLLNYMLDRGFISPKVLEGILSEYYDGTKEN